MKFLSKIPIAIIAATIVLSVNIVSVAYANDNSSPSDNVAQTESNASVARSEVTGYKYTTINGVKYKRLWSYTYGVWIDPYWIPCE